MKRGLVLVVLLVFFFLLPSVLADGGLVSVTPGTNLWISVVRYDPMPVAPGEYMDVWVALESQGDDPQDGLSDLDVLNDVEIKLVQKYPFTTSDDVTQYVGTIDKGERVVVKYRVKVDEAATIGTNLIHFQVKTSESSQFLDVPGIDITVQAPSATMVIDSVTTVPEILTPGEPAEVVLVLRNDAGTALREVNVKLDLSSSDLQIAPINTGTEKRVSQIDVGKSEVFAFEVIPYSDADSGVVKVPVTITFSDSLSNDYTMNEYVGLLVGGKIILDVDLVEFDTFYKNKKGSVVVSLVNNGPSEALHTTLDLQDGEGYTVLSNRKDYLGNLESDDFETSEFEIYVNDDRAVLDFVLTYTDAFNNEYEENILLDVPVYTTGEITAYGLDSVTRQPYLIMLYILIVLFLFYGFRSWRQTKDLEKAVIGGVKGTLMLFVRIIFWFRWKNLRTIPKRVRAAFMRV